MPRVTAEVNDLVLVNEFTYVNPQGGTTNVKLKTRPLKALVTKAFEDSETGWNYHGVEACPELHEFLMQNASNKNQTIYFSEWEIATVLQPEPAPRYSNKFTDLTNTIDKPMRRKILALARKEFPGRYCDITVKYKKFYFLDRPGHIMKLVVDIVPFDLKNGEEAAHYAELGEEQNPPNNQHPFTFPRD
jgi:hypothetical protein